MATMVKEKRREKKKTKEKSRARLGSTEEIFLNVSETTAEETPTSLKAGVPNDQVIDEKSPENVASTSDNKHLVIAPAKSITCEKSLTIETKELAENKTVPEKLSLSFCSSKTNEANTSVPHILELNPTASEFQTESASNMPCLESTKDRTVSKTIVENFTDNYEYLNTRLKRMTIPDPTEPISEARELELSDSNAYLKLSSKKIAKSENTVQDVVNVIPSAPTFEEELQPQVTHQEEVMKKVKTKVQCMPLEEAVNMFGGAEMNLVKLMSEKEEAIVEAGPISGPEHPLLDLLSTFRSSLRALENERSRLTCGFADEEKSRSSLWKIEKRHIYQKKQCKCGMNIELKAVYEHAELLRERMPVARLRLEGLLRDVQDSYCHHQHAALLAHCQIEELVAETIGSNKGAIREALSLVLQALRMSDGAAVLAAALRRWAAALVAALVDERDVSQLLFVLHHLFRQSRSVRWAASVLRPRVTDAASAARTLAVLDTLLASPRLDTALECTEDAAEEAWEEVSARGAGGAVSEGALREIDLLALLRAFPLRDLVSRILLFTHSDIRDARAYEWGDCVGGSDVMRACCGVRALLAACARAAAAHAQYARLRAALRTIGAAALQALACLYQSPRTPYHKELEEKIQAELEACFTAGLALFGTQDLHKLTTELLTDDAAKDYCLTFITGLHDKSPKLVESLSVELPVLPCDTRVRVVTHAAANRTRDHELAGIVMDFLIQTGAKVKSTSCKGGCASAARACVPVLLAAHAYLRTGALHALASLAQAEPVEESVVDMLHVQSWRAECDEVRAVLDDWARRCPLLVHRLLLQLDYTPFTGVSLPVQLLIGRWVCEWSRSHPAYLEQCWRVMVSLRVHRVCWRMELDAPAPDPEPTDALSTAYALLASSWGHCIPLICSWGVSALCSLTSRPREAVHCLAPVMLVMAHSPESVSLTPKFTELFTALLTSGPTLVQRALGRGGAAGADILLTLVLSQLDGETSGPTSRARVLSSWLHALCRCGPAAGTVDAAALAARDWPTLDAHAALLLQEENAKDHVTNFVRNASVAPLFCECLLRAYHTHRELNTGMFGAIANILWEQRVNGQRIHVDNALQKIKADVSSEELVMYRSAAAALVAPLHHPSHLTLWRLFFHLYLQRPPSNMRETALPVGPLYYSGLIKTRTLAQIKKRLQETATYHHNEAETYKNDSSRSSQQPSNRIVKSESITIEKGLLPALTIKNLTGESSDSSDSDSDDFSESEQDSNVEARQVDDTSDVDKKNAFNMACYHTAAERMVREFCSWLEDGDRVRASPHHADIARFIPEQALESAWQQALTRIRPPASDAAPFPSPAPRPAPPPALRTAPLDVAVDTIMRIKNKSRIRSGRKIRSPLEDIDVNTSSRLFDAIDNHLRDIDTLAKEWNSEVSRISTIDTKLWELVAVLRVPRPLPPVTKQCHNTKVAQKCKPIVFYINEREWCISTGAEQAIKENRSSSLASLRRLCRARPLAARSAAALHSIARSVRDAASAASAAERAWAAAGTSAAGCAAARHALTAFVELLAERWIRHDANMVQQLLSRWCSKSCNSLQETLCGSLLSPRHMDLNKWPLVYTTLLKSKLPSHTIFSYLSKFEMSQWSCSASPPARRQLVSALISAQAQRGAAPDPQHSVLLELLGVHTTAVTTGEELAPVVMQCASLAADGRLPPSQWTHVTKAAVAVGSTVPFDRLGNLLRELGALWWQARSLYHGATTLVPHAAYVADVQCTLLRCFVAAAVALSYQPERVGRCSWSATLESWSAWVSPLPAPPLLPSLPSEGGGQYSHMLQCFITCLTTIMADCPGSEVSVLQSTFEWCAATQAAVAGAARQEARVQASELLTVVGALPWEQHQWFYGAALQVATQICATNDREIMSWSCDRWRATNADTLLRDVTDDTIAPRLAALLYLFTGAQLRHQQHILDEAARLPWWRLPEQMLGEALDRFFAVHHDAAQAYHDLPEFQVLLYASELRVQRPVAGPESRDKRLRATTQWARAAAAPALLPHVARHSHCVLQTLTELAPYLEGSEGELEELLERATVIMCMEPAAAEALPVWEKWLCSAPAQMSSACVSAACAITALPYCAALADAAVRAHLRTNECGWDQAAHRWSRSPWPEPAVFVARARLHAAYACARAQQTSTAPAAALPVLQALLTADINFVEDEVIVAVWICYVCRVARACAASGASEREECGRAARALVGAWAQPPRRSILRVVTLQPDTDRTTALHRLLCRLAECILSPSAETVQTYETTCLAAPGNNNDVLTWGRNAAPRLLPRLAVRLYPKYERYFTCEMEAVSDRS